jgi:prepilin-type N-terminal cleavage/methylation domain-containing protein
MVNHFISINMKKFNKGFTLVELLVVIAIIGILASIIVVSLNSARQNAVQSKIQSEVGQIRNQLEANYLNGGYPDLVGGTGNFAATSTNVLDSILSSVLDMQGATTSLGMLNTSTSDPYNGVQIFTDVESGTPTKYSVYAKTGELGYYCIGSDGQTLENADSNMLPVPVAEFGTCI